MSEDTNVPQLGDWVNLTEAAEVAGITRQYSYRLAKRTMEGKKGGWASLHRIGTKLIHVVSRAEAEERRKLADEKKSESEQE